MGAQKGAYEHVFLCIFFVFNLLHCVLSPAFAPKTIVIIGKPTTINTLYNEAGR
ncbi:hypothetical protein AIC27_003696 [Salmonella enterica subsp. houtenae]|nr:hypothetical protein [Salmonella enterica subsp. houtenae]